MMPALKRLAYRVGVLRGWRRWGFLIFLGAFATLALPPVNCFPAFILSGVGLVWCLVYGPNGRWSGFGVGWAFSFGYFVFGLYWIGNALLVFADQHAWMLPFASLGLPAFLAVFGGLAGLAASFARGPLAMALAVTAAFSVADWLRGNILTGLPWNLFGHVWTGIDPLLQSASLYGIYGMGVAALLTATLPSALVSSLRWQRFVATILPITILGTHWAAGEIRLAGLGVNGSAGVGIRLVQANIPQREKWAPQYRDRNIRAHLRLSIENRPPWVRHIIWPEMAATLYLARDLKSRQALSSVIPEKGLLITGAPRRNWEGGTYNAILALDDTGQIAGYYDKSHLVPFGEYVPLASVLPFEKITQGASGYLPGSGVQTLRLPGLPPASFLVCYEIIFPANVINDSDRPEVIVNVTNDAWYGATSGPHQHFSNARLRAVEEGMPVVRAAYTGISGVIDSYGRVLGTIPLNVSGYFDFRLPAPLRHVPLYSRLGDTVFFAMVVVIVLLTAGIHRLEKIRFV
tara:strand:- start:1 stop:1551 length:1551 start_codon:yes stop_codon:yes gene_type:complete